MKKTAIFTAILAAGALIAQPWEEDFEAGLDEWIMSPPNTLIQVVDDANEKYGKVLQVSAQENVTGIHTPHVSVPADSAGKNWVIEFDIRSEGVTKGLLGATTFYYDANRKVVGQNSLLYVNPESATHDWKHFRAVLGTGNRKIPETAKSIGLRFGFWSKDRKCTGTVYFDNVAITPPRKDSDLWFTNFEKGLTQCTVSSKTAPVKLIQDPDTRYGQVVQISSDARPSGITTELLPVPANSSGNLWDIELDFRLEGNISSSGTIGMQYFNADKKMIGQCSLLYLQNLKPEDYRSWKHVRNTVGSGNRMLPAEAKYCALWVGFWKKGENCTGTLVVDNIKVLPPLSNE